MYSLLVEVSIALAILRVSLRKLILDVECLLQKGLTSPGVLDLDGLAVVNIDLEKLDALELINVGGAVAFYKDFFISICSCMILSTTYGC